MVVKSVGSGTQMAWDGIPILTLLVGRPSQVI